MPFTTGYDRPSFTPTAYLSASSPFCPCRPSVFLPRVATATAVDAATAAAASALLLLLQPPSILIFPPSRGTFVRPLPGSALVNLRRGLASEWNEKGCVSSARESSLTRVCRPYRRDGREFIEQTCVIIPVTLHCAVNNSVLIEFRAWCSFVKLNQNDNDAR